MSRRTSTRALITHHVRSHAGSGAVVAVLVLVLSILATAAPLAVGLLGDAALRTRLDTVAPTERDVVSRTLGLPQIPALAPQEQPTTDAMWGDFLAGLDGIRSSADEPLPEILAEAVVISRTAESGLAEAPRTRELSVGFAPEYESHIRLVEGRLPEASTYAGDFSNGHEGGSRVEIALSADSAAEMEWPLGEVRSIHASTKPTEFTLTGTFEALDPADDYWQHVPSVLQPNIFDDGNAPRRVTATGFAHPASVPVAFEFSQSQTTDIWYPVDAAMIQTDTAAQTSAALNKLTSTSHTIATSAGGVGILGVKLEANLIPEIELALAQQASTLGVLVMIIAGPVGVAAAVLILGGRLILETRRPSLRLLSARGTSVAQLRGLLGIEGVLVGLVPAAAGAALVAVAAALMFGAVPGIGDFVPALIIGLAPIAILLVLAPAATERRTRADLGRRGSRLRVISEGLIAALAIVALVLLFVRGYSGGADLLLAATPLLLALVACLLTLRLYPLPLRAVFSRAQRSSGLDTFLGSARALREPSIGLTPVLALVVGVSVAVSSGVLLSALQSGITEASRAQIGADMRIVGASFTRDQLDLVREVAGVAEATGISGAEPTMLDIQGSKRATSAFVVDAADLRSVQGDGPGMLPPGVSLEPVDGEPMPLVVAGATADLIDGSDELSMGGVPAAVAGVTRGPVPVGGRENWVAIDSSYAEEVLGRDPTDRTLLVRVDPGASIEQVDRELRAVLGSGVRIDDAATVAEAIQSGPSVQGVRWALLIATAVAALLSALAIVMTLALAADPRARVLALLRTLGSPPRSAGSITLWEVGPPAVAAVIAGTLFGALVPLVVLGAVDLRPFTGSSVQPAYQIDLATLALTLGGFVLLAVVFTGIALLISRRVRTAGALRTMEEG